MFSGGSDLPQKPFQLIKQDDKFFSRLLSKENSAPTPSFRVYYGGVPSSVPFMWETRPGTPKHPHFDDSLPPLTPPPSYYSSSSKYDTFPKKKCSRSNLLRVLFFKTSLKKPKNVADSTCSLHSSSSSSSNSSVFGPMTPTRRWFSSRRLMSYDSSIDDEDEHTGSLPTPTRCFGSGRKWCSFSTPGRYRRWNVAGDRSLYVIAWILFIVLVCSYMKLSSLEYVIVLEGFLIIIRSFLDVRMALSAIVKKSWCGEQLCVMALGQAIYHWNLHQIFRRDKDC